MFYVCMVCSGCPQWYSRSLVSIYAIVACFNTRQFVFWTCANCVVTKMADSKTVLSAMRKNYKTEEECFTEDDLVSKEPFANFQHWLDIACKSEGILEPNAMSLATATKNGRPSVRVVLLKGFSKEGFVFFSNYESRKGRELAENPHASLGFYWTSTSHNQTNWSRQVRVEGRTERLSAEESSAYFHERPRSSQIGACVSRQSTPIASRKVLKDKQEELEQKYADPNTEIPRPDYWGGIRVVPEVVEFWQGQTTRLHDRIVFRRPAPGEEVDPEVTRRGEDGWVYERLSP